MEWKEYRNSGVLLQYPANWYVRDKQLEVREMIVMISEEQLDSTCDNESAELIRNVNLAAELLDLDNEDFKTIKDNPMRILEQYVKNKLKILEVNIENFKLLERENSILSGYLSTKIIYTGKFLNNSLKWAQFFFVVDKDIISTLTATALESKFNEHFVTIIDKMVNSIELVA